MMILPWSKPKATRERVIAAARRQWHLDQRKQQTQRALPELFVCGVRGYYRDTMGQPGVNDRNLYDDALFVVGPDTFAGFHGNTDPSPFRPGVATLIPGCYPYRPGMHGISKGNGYPAFRPATHGERLPVTRDGSDEITTGVALNIHRGGWKNTSSLGCQTIHPAEWTAFHALLHHALKNTQLKRFWYILTEGPIT